MRRLVIIGLMVVLVPVSTMVGLWALRSLNLGFRMMSDAEKAEYLVGAATHRNHAEVEKALRLGVPAAGADPFGFTALMAAAGAGDAELVRRLLDAGAQPNASVRIGKPRMPEGATALMIAAEGEHIAVMPLLIGRGVDVNARTRSGAFRGESALSVAVRHGQMEAVTLLLSNGARVDLYAIDEKGFARFPLELALTTRRLDIAEQLVAAGSRVDWIVPEGPNSGCTLLMQLVDSRPFLSAAILRWAVRASRRLDYYGESGERCKDASAYMRAEAVHNYDAAIALLQAGSSGLPRGVPERSVPANHREELIRALERTRAAR